MNKEDNENAGQGKENETFVQGEEASSDPSDVQGFSRNYKLRKSFFVLIFQLIFLELIFALIGVVGYWLASLFEATEFNFFGGVFLIFQIVNLISIIIVFLFWYTSYYVISPDAILISKGILRRRARTCNMSSISSVKVSQNVFQRIFRYGTVELITPLESEFILKKVQQPYKHAKLIDFQRLKHVEGTEDVATVI